MWYTAAGDRDSARHAVATQAKLFLTELKLLLTHLDVSDCEMQEGSLRVDANVNLRIDNDGQWQSRRSLKSRIEQLPVGGACNWLRDPATVHRLGRDGATIENNPKVTRGWDDTREQTFLQREKEASADYRYFPDPTCCCQCACPRSASKRCVNRSVNCLLRFAGGCRRSTESNRMMPT